MASPIIAATDFSPTSDSAVAYACELAKSTGSKLVLFHAYSLSIHSQNYRISSDDAEQDFNKTTERLNILGDHLSKQHKLKVDSFCIYLPLEQELPVLIGAYNAEIVVMGMAESSLEQDLLGNSTTSVIKNICIPVLAVPKNARFNDVKKILFAFDNLNLSAVKRLDWFISKAKIFKAEVEFFSVDQKDGELNIKPNRSDMIDEQDLEVKVVYKTLNSDKVLIQIKKEIKNYSADILVMVPQKHGFWDSLVHISKTRSIAAGLEIPLLSLPNY